MTGLAHSVVGEFTEWHRENAEELEGGQGWFAWLHPLDPHDPYEPSEGFRKFTGQELPNEAELRERWREAEPLVEKYRRGRPAWEFEEAALDMRKMSNLYDGEVVQVDDAFARLLAYLDETGERERTLIIFASDHGEKLWEHMRYPRGIRSRLRGSQGAPEGVKDFFAYGHRAWFHEELWNTPLILVGPGIPAGFRSQALSANLDIYPTVLEAFGLPYVPGLAGQSIFGGVEPGRDSVFAYGFETSVTLAREGTKLIEHPAATFLREDGGLVPELFDLAQDPHELHDACADQPDACAELTSNLAAWRVEQARQVEQGGLSEADRKALRDLGYLGDEDDE